MCKSKGRVEQINYRMYLLRVVFFDWALSVKVRKFGRFGWTAQSVNPRSFFFLFLRINRWWVPWATIWNVLPSSLFRKKFKLYIIVCPLSRLMYGLQKCFIHEKPKIVHQIKEVGLTVEIDRKKVVCWNFSELFLFFVCFF